jgi:molecular chaperone Hsp33
MNLPSTHDQLNRFIFDDLAVRGEIVQLHDVYTELFHSKKYPLSIKKILAQLTMVCNLLTVNMKIEGDVTVEIRGDGLLRYASVNSDNRLNFRGIARHNISDPDSDCSFRELVGTNSILLITVHPAAGEPYQGIVDVTGYSLSETLENYFLRSEQIETKIMLEIQISDEECFGGGIILQAMPKPDSGHDDDFNTVSHLLNTLTKDELLYLESDEILFRLFNQFAVRLFTAMPVSYKCACTREKCLVALEQMGTEEIARALKESEHNAIMMTCAQCGKKFTFDAKEIKDFISRKPK